MNGCSMNCSGKESYMKKNVLITMSLLTVLGIAGCSSNNTAAVVFLKIPRLYLKILQLMKEIRIPFPQRKMTDRMLPMLSPMKRHLMP